MFYTHLTMRKALVAVVRAKVTALLKEASKAARCKR
jgi:hypothetical protein